MADRKKAILGLECCAKSIGKCAECPYNVFTDDDGNGLCLIDNMLSDALALLREQEARVLTWNEIVRSIEIESPSIWVEDRDKIHVIPALTIISCVTNSENATFVMRGKRVNVKHEDYNKRWRAWTEKPTSEQRREVPWEVEDDD